MKPFARIAVSLGILLVPVLASAQVPYQPGYTQNVTTGYSMGFFSTSGGFGVGVANCTGNIACTADTILYIINYVLVPVLFAIAFIVFLYGIARAYIFSYGDPEKVKEGHRLVLWGIIAFAVMISIWGLVNVVANTFGLGGYYAPQTPSSISPYGSAVPVDGTTNGTTYIECPKDANGNCK